MHDAALVRLALNVAVLSDADEVAELWSRLSAWPVTDRPADPLAGLTALSDLGGFRQLALIQFGQTGSGRNRTPSNATGVRS